MGAVDTTYTFTATDTITSTKMNNIIDQTTITTDAIIGNTLEVASGKLKVRAQGITSNEMATGSVTSNAILDGTIVNADINASAAIVGTKISPDFGSQNITTTGTLSANVGSVISGSGSSDGLRITQTGSGNALVIEDSTSLDATPVIIDSSGQLISGSTSQVAFTHTSTPRVEIIGTTTATSCISTVTFNATADSPSSMLLGRSRGTQSSPIIVNSGDDIGWLQFEAHDGVGLKPAARIVAEVDGAPGANDMPGRLVFSTTANGSASPTERMRITNSGDIGIGKTPTTKLDVNGTVTATAFAGPITGDVTGNATTATTLQTARTIAISGDVTGTATSFNGSANITIPVTIDNDSITTAKIANSTSTTTGVTNAKIADNAVTEAKIADSSITTNKISNGDVTATKLSGAQTGSAPIYGARAWVNFNGTGTVAIRSSGNVSSITDNGVGDYTINFTTAMPNANYSVIGMTNDAVGNEGRPVVVIAKTLTTTSVRITTTGVFDNNTNKDCSGIYVVVFG